MLPYFASHNYHCEEHDNPADFALDVLIEVSKMDSSLQQLANSYTDSEMHTRIAKLITEVEPNGNAIYKSEDERPDEKKRSWTTETFHVAQRTLRNAVRNPQLFFSQTIVGAIMGLLIGLVFYKIELTEDKGVQNRMGAIFFIVVSQVYSTVTALEPLLKERTLFIHVSLLYIFHIFYI
jgi:ATP-binding cassette subfamily G (WHITE) protein 2